MNSEARKVLLELQSQSKGEYVFENGKTGTSLTTIKTGFRSACEDAEIYDFRFHDLRHTTGTRMADAGADAFAIAEVLGHGSLQMTKRYTHATDKRKGQALEAITNLGNCQKFAKNKRRQSA